MAKDILSINKAVLRANGVTMTEFLLMLMLLYQPNLNVSFDCSNLLSYGYIHESDVGYLLTTDGINFIKDVEVKSVDETINVKSVKELANAMKNLYPEGKKTGTNKYWRGNSSEVIKKLMTFFKEHGKYSDETVIFATEKYVNSFGSDKQLMRILPYFIMKDGNSELLTFIENIDNISENKNDDLWTSNLV